MATFSEYVKNLFWVLLLVQLAPVFIRNIRSSYGELLEEKTRVGVIPIKGTISDIGPTCRTIKKFFKDKTIKALVLKIESPGGSAPASQALFQEILHFKQMYPEKPIISYIEQIGASGAYLIATTGDYIVATSSALVGSVGALIPEISIKKLLEQYNVSYSLIKSGKYKGAGSALLGMTDEQRMLFQKMSDNVYRQFMKDVTTQRPQLSHDHAIWADGKVFTGEQALGVKLIDATGSPATVEQVLQDRAQIVGRIEWVKPSQRKSLLAQALSEDDDESDSTYLETAVNSLCSTLEQRYGALSVSL